MITRPWCECVYCHFWRYLSLKCKYFNFFLNAFIVSLLGDFFFLFEFTACFSFDQAILWNDSIGRLYIPTKRYLLFCIQVVFNPRLIFVTIEATFVMWSQEFAGFPFVHSNTNFHWILIYMESIDCAESEYWEISSWHIKHVSSVDRCDVTI